MKMHLNFSIFKTSSNKYDNPAARRIILLSSLFRVLSSLMQESIETLAVRFAAVPTLEGFNPEMNNSDVSCKSCPCTQHQTTLLARYFRSRL